MNKGLFTYTKSKQGLRTRIVCPNCQRIRWVNKSDITGSKNWTGKCKNCSDKRLSLHGKEHLRWKGGRAEDGHGYVLITIEKNDFFYPMVNSHGYILEHRYIVAKKLKRLLENWEVVHHLNGIKNDNRIENLELVNSNVEHYIITKMEKRIRELEKEIMELKGENNNE